MLILRRCLPLLLLAGALGLGYAEEAPKITLEAADKPVAEVLALIQAQAPKVQLCATQASTANVTVKLTDASVEAAVKAVAKALKGTCLRGYIIERTGPGETPYTAADYIDFIKTARDEWRRRLTPEQTKALDERVRAYFRGLGQGGQEMPRPDALSYDDPLLRWTMSPTAEKINLTADAVTVQQGCDLFMLESGYTVLVEAGVEGTVTLTGQGQELPPLLDKLAEAGKAKWREFYLVSQPVKLSEQEVDQRADKAFGEMWSGFWSSPPEERAKDIQRVVENLNGIPPVQIQFIKAMPIAQKMFARMFKATMTLTPAQRDEFQPIIQAVGKIMGQ
ncbi:MAG: hypothetical protein WCP21_09140 [Armatimonadota bacterium]